MPQPDETARIGLCASCRHCRIVQGDRSTFYMCLRALTDSEYRKYPSLPVVRCAGYENQDGKLTR
ncbi:MAG: hypothetical protein RLZZ53_2452 [Acidobacteriota bacterium]|jgi:hypothetical protein